jgi:hypothetical protein
MATIEFDAMEENGMIKIPQEYINNISGSFKVILIFNDEEKAEDNNVSSKFNAVKIRTKGFKFNKEEANER